MINSTKTFLFLPVGRVLGTVLLVLLCFACAGNLAHAAEFAVSPIKLFFDRQTRSAVINVSNDAEEPLVVQMSLARWTQDADAKDVYVDSEDFQFFPRLMAIPPKDKRTIRVGVRAPAGGDGEMTYRLFINEVLEQREKSNTPTVRLAFRFALPIFVAPIAPAPAAEISDATFTAGTEKNAGKVVAKISVRNKGNENFRIESLRIAALPAGSTTSADGWYLLPGTARDHTLLIDPIDCKQVKQLELTVKADKLALSKLLDVPPAVCRK